MLKCVATPGGVAGVPDSYGEGAVIGARCELKGGMRVFPGVQIPDAGVRFSSDA